MSLETGQAAADPAKCSAWGLTRARVLGKDLRYDSLERDGRPQHGAVTRTRRNVHCPAQRVQAVFRVCQPVAENRGAEVKATSTVNYLNGELILRLTSTHHCARSLRVLWVFCMASRTQKYKADSVS